MVWGFASDPAKVPTRIIPAKAKIIHFGNRNKNMKALATQIWNTAMIKIGFLDVNASVEPHIGHTLAVGSVRSRPHF